MNQAEYLKIDESRDGLHSKFCNLRDTQLKWYKSEALKHFGIKRLPSKNDNQIIQQILGKSPNDKQKKKKDKTYYVANVVAYLNVVKNLLSDKFIEKFSTTIATDESLLIYNYHRVFQGLLFDSLILLNEYNQNVKGKASLYNCSKSSQQHNLTIYQSLRYSIFGQSSFDSCREVEPDLSISIIRQLIELRVRRAFGVLGWYKPITQSVDPLPMNLLFDAIDQYKNNVDFSMPFNCLKRIYGWSNIFLHSGIKDYSWKYIFVMNYLKEFALGKSNSNNVNSGIVLKQDILDKIIADLKKSPPKGAEGAEVISCIPEANILNA